MSKLTIRNAKEADVPLILHFVKELASYENALDEVLATEEHIRQSIFGEDARVEALICENAGQPIGFAVYFYNYSTWLGKLGLFLEDLYVSPEQRGVGAGKALLAHLAKLAVAKDCGRFEWNVLDWNKPSIEFYESLGAQPQSEWIGYRLTGDSLHKLASGE